MNGGNGRTVGFVLPPGNEGPSYLNDSINQRDMSDQMMAGYPLSPPPQLVPMAKQMVNRSALKDEYKGYLADLGSSIKNKKSRVEIEREKQMNR